MRQLLILSINQSIINVVNQCTNKYFAFLAFFVNSDNLINHKCALDASTILPHDNLSWTPWKNYIRLFLFSSIWMFFCIKKMKYFRNTYNNKHCTILFFWTIACVEPSSLLAVVMREHLIMQNKRLFFSKKNLFLFTLYLYSLDIKYSDIWACLFETRPMVTTIYL